jgi:uncharacterized membrane protein YgcG
MFVLWITPFFVDVWTKRCHTVRPSGRLRGGPLMWFSIVFFTIVAVLFAGYLWQTRQRKMLRQRSRITARSVGGGYHGSYGGATHGDHSSSGYSGDCGFGGGGGDGGGGGGGGC